MSKQERRKMEVSMMNSEQKEVRNMQANNRLLEEMLSDENQEFTETAEHIIDGLSG